ncbi:sigma-70 family RNA polymerase sigma factor, partial [Streptomyces sp. JJ38]|uniref:sigma-70 family RNA polymerase sigma factor n=1 Tax=Streptomyces sp. JJ38 TaxID=2738128 RepID=UPI001C5950DE|nr:sigma-70 family RNA polymerase sigma factor [Streptomyces sp. JJ38]
MGVEGRDGSGSGSGGQEGNGRRPGSKAGEPPGPKVPGQSRPASSGARHRKAPGGGRLGRPGAVPQQRRDDVQERKREREPAATGAAGPPLVGSEAALADSGEGEVRSGPADVVSDTELVVRMREGDAAAYDEIYRRHADAVRRYARTCCRDADTADDLTNEVFVRTLQAVRGGKGPQTAVRAYLMTSVRHAAAAWARTSRREHLVEDFAAFAVAAAGGRRAAADETLDFGAEVHAMHEAEQTMVVTAFRALPERWQTVLWHTMVEESPPSEVAPLLGLTANATAVLAHRAREGLKQAYLQAHVSQALTTDADCSRYADQLGAFARGGLRTRAERGLRKHLDTCGRCRTAAMEVSDLNTKLRALLPVAVIGWFAATYSVKAVAGAVGGAGGVAVAGGAAAATGGVGGAGAAGGSGAAG